ncbi:MAG: hypothetical protein V4437_01645 [Patescibacteria group bacterium]
MAYEARAIADIEMSAEERALYNGMEPGVRKDLVTEYLRIRPLWKKSPEQYGGDWRRIQGLMRAHDGD